MLDLNDGNDPTGFVRKVLGSIGRPISFQSTMYLFGVTNSELRRLAKSHERVLDVACGAGGLVDKFRAYGLNA